jgi:GMP synthase (glutamine-hydrolysing)
VCVPKIKGDCTFNVQSLSIYKEITDRGDNLMAREMIIVLDFGGQYNQLIARRVRECNVYCEVHPYNMSLDQIRQMNPKGIIFTGGPDVVFEDGAPRCSKEIFELGIPVLGICYGAQLMLLKKPL